MGTLSGETTLFIFACLLNGGQIKKETESVHVGTNCPIRVDPIREGFCKPLPYWQKNMKVDPYTLLGSN